MFETLLVPLDGSSSAEIVFPFAEEIAVNFGSVLSFVAVTAPGSYELERICHSYLGRVREQVQTQLGNYQTDKVTKIYTHVLPGNPADEILRYAEALDASAIIMSSRGSSNRGPWLLGSIANKVARASKRPMIIIRAAADRTATEQKKLFGRILVPLDGSIAGEAAIPFAEALAHSLGSELVLFYVVEPPAAWTGYGIGGAYAIPQESETTKAYALTYLEGVRQRLTEKRLAVTVELEYGQPADLIIDYSKAKGIDVIAISTHGRSGIDRWVFGSVTEKVLHYGDTTVLVVRATKT
jgi:nucleotide-binding universal stress UspA family protein